MSGWTTKKLGEVCESISTRGCQIQQNEICDIGKFPVVSQSEAFIEGYTDFENAIENIPVVLFGDHTCCVKYIDFPFVVGADGTKLLTAKQFEVKFLYYAILKISSSLVDGKYRRHFKDLKKCDIPILPLAEQKRIVAKIDAAFEKIDRLKANAEKNLANAKELFQSALDEAMRPKKGWVEKRLGEVYNFIDYRGKTPTKIDQGIPLVTARNIRMGYLDYSVRDFISLAEYKTRQSRGIAHKGDILFTTEAPLGFVALADLDEFSTGQRVITFQQYEGLSFQLLNAFYYYYFQAKRFQSEIRKQATGATAQGIKASRLRNIPIAVVPIAEQKQIIKHLDFLSEKIKMLEQNYERQIADCAEMRQAILREAFEGKL